MEEKAGANEKTGSAGWHLHPALMRYLTLVVQSFYIYLLSGKYFASRIELI